MVLDLVIILVVLLFTFFGYTKGLVKTAISILSFFIALIISLILYKTVGNIIINNTQIDENIEKAITSKVTIDNLEEKYEMLPDSLVEAGENKIGGLVKSLSEKAVYIVSFIVLFIVLKIALIFVKVLAGIITKIPVIKQFDKLRRNNIRFCKGIFNSNSDICWNIACISNDRSKIHQYDK